MTTRLLPVFALGLLLALASASTASAGSVAMHYCHNFAATQSDEKQKDLPLYICYFKTEDIPKPGYGNVVLALQFNTAYKNLPEIDMLYPTQDAAFLQMVKRLGCATFPLAILCDCRGHILGVFFPGGPAADHGQVKETDARPPADQVATARTIVNWEMSVEDQLPSLDDKLKNHQFAAVSDLIAQIDAQDKKFTNQLGAAVPWQPADQQEPWFYKKEVRDAKDKLKEAIKKELQADTELLAAGKRQQARLSLGHILFYKDDPELAKKIVELKKQFDHDPKADGLTATAPVSATSAAPPAAK
jgi:hypothetical protein